MKKKICLISLILLALVSCNNDEILQINNGNKIVFRTAIDTRATELTAERLNSFYVTALTEEGENYFTNVLFEKDNNGMFVSSQEYYWPAEGSLEFYAYAYNPYNIQYESITINSEAKMMNGFKANSEISQQIDFVSAHATGNKEDNVAGITLTFKHQLSQIEVKGKNTNRGYEIIVKGMKIVNVAYKGDFSLMLDVWTPKYDELTNYEVQFYTPITLSDNLASFMNNMGNAMLVPQARQKWSLANNNVVEQVAEDEGEDDTEGEGEGETETETETTDPNGFRLDFYLQINTKDGARVFPSDGSDYGGVTQPIAIQWVGGYKYTYNCDFSYGAGIDPSNEEPIYGEKINVSVNFSNLNWSQQNWNTIDVGQE